MIHPILLLIAISSSLYNFSLGRFYKNIFSINLIYILAIFFGGLWAQQEFSWGGWWNWDFVELGIFLTWCGWLTATHLDLHIRTLILFFIKFIYFILFCACLNKWGITISVHRFIQSTVFNNFYFYYILVLVLLGLNFFKKGLLIITFICIGSIFYMFKDLLFLKVLLIFSVMWFKTVRGSLLQRFWHVTVMFLFLLLAIFNFFNFNFFLSTDYSTYFIIFFYDEVFRFSIYSWLNAITFLSAQDIFFFKILNIWYSYELLISFFYQQLKLFVYYF